MKILITTGIYPPDIGGPAGYVETIAKEFVRLGHQVRVLTYSDSLDGQIIKDGYRVFFVRRKNKILNYFNYFLRVFESAKGADVIYLQDSVSAGLPTTLANLFLRKRLILKIVGDYAWEAGGNETTPILDDFYPTTSVIASEAKQSSDSKSKRDCHVAPQYYKTSRNNKKIEILKRIQTWVAKKADKIITPSEYLKKIVCIGWNVREDKISVIYNAIEYKSEIRNPKSETNYKLEIQNSNQKNTIISVGRLVPWKGFDCLIELMPEVLKINPQAKLEIIGSGPEEENLKKLATRLNLEEKVVFTGRISHKEVLQRLQNAGVFVLNTRYEGLSHILLEALSCGVPVVTTNVGGNPEIIRDYENGYLVDFNDKLTLKNAILKLWEYKEVKHNFVNNGFKILEKFSFSKMIEDTQKALSFTSSGLRVLMISTDKTILDKESNSAERMRDYGKICDKLDILVFNTDKLRDITKLSENVMVYPTNSINKPFAVFDCINIGNKLIEEEKINVVTTQDPFETGFIGWRLARKHKIGLNVQMHGDFYGNDYWINESLLNEFRDKLGRFVLKRANSVRVVSQRIKNSLKSMKIGGEVIVAPIFTDTEKIKNTPAKFNLKEKYPGQKIFLAVGRLEKEKNYPFMFEVFKKVLEELPESLLFIIGEGSMKKELEEKVKEMSIQNKVIFENYKDDLISYYKNADYYLLTSNYEGWGRSVIEARASQKPIILMRDVGVAGEIIRNEKDGIVCSTNNEFTTAIINLEKDDNLRKKILECVEDNLKVLNSKENIINLIKKSWNLAKF